jgi:hypothetical protein
MPLRATRAERTYIVVGGLAAATLFLMSFVQWRENVHDLRSKRSACDTGGAISFRGSEYRMRDLVDSRLVVAPRILGRALVTKAGCGARRIEVHALQATVPGVALSVAGSRQRLLVRAGICTEARNERALVYCLKLRQRAVGIP